MITVEAGSNASEAGKAAIYGGLRCGTAVVIAGCGDYKRR
jgi:hypothetical protein